MIKKILKRSTRQDAHNASWEAAKQHTLDAIGHRARIQGEAVTVTITGQTDSTVYGHVWKRLP